MLVDTPADGHGGRPLVDSPMGRGSKPAREQPRLHLVAQPLMGDSVTGTGAARGVVASPEGASVGYPHLKVDCPKLSPEDETKLMEAQRSNKMSE